MYTASSDDDSYIDMYAHVEQTTRSTSHQRVRPKNVVIRSNDTKHVAPNSSKAPKNAPVLPRHNKESSGLLGSFLEHNTKTAQPKRSSTGNRSACSAPTVISFRTPTDLYEDNTTGLRKSTSRSSLRNDSELAPMMGSLRVSTSTHPERVESGSQSFLSSPHGTRTTGTSRRSLTGSSSTDRRAESSRSLRHSSSSARMSSRVLTSSAGPSLYQAGSTLCLLFRE